MAVIQDVNELLKCCELVFPENTRISKDFITYLRPDGLKKAFREKIKHNHPDKAGVKGIDSNLLTEKFIRIREAYESLLPFVSGERSLQALLGESRKEKAKTGSKKDSGRSNRNSASKNTAEKTTRFDFFHSGAIPSMKLRFSQYLYYRGRISWKQCMGSLAWQRDSRPLFGQLAVQWNYLSHPDVMAILKSVQPRESFGETAIRLKRLTPYQVFALLGKQSLYNARVGRYFIDNNILSEKELAQLLRDFYFHNFSFSTARN